MKGRLVIVADRDPLRGDVPELLRQAGYEIKGVLLGPQAPVAAYRFMPELVLYYWPSDSADAEEVFVHLRNTVDVPILVLPIDHGGKDFAVRVLRLGADDCLCEPYRNRELLARVKAHWRRYWQWSKADAQEIPVIDPVSRSIIIREQRVKLTENEYRLLRCLIRHDGGVVNRQELRNAIWGAGAERVSSTSLNLCVHRLRKKIERDPHRPEYIVTKWGVGYYLARKVRGA
ncbi:MAG: response regulator transcription factor [Chloroflexota bacterium]|nr:response regulator transcription factor [Chloroflexota bacterium]